MIQKESYIKDITREIDGVIKAESDAHLAEEVKEYVITAEQMRPNLLPRVFKGLQPGGVNNCIWITGDFGSGKSHLLKILSYVLENKLEVDGEKCADIFADKCGSDFELKKSIQDACKIPTISILFNIQKKLDAIASKSIDPVLAIFLKEFNSSLGYDDKKPQIAEIERYFASKGKYEWLKSEYLARFGTEWVKDRPTIILKLQRLAEIFADMENIDLETAKQNLRSQIDNYSIDSDGFVKLVKAYLDEKPGKRLIFFVDEVGQFIGNDVDRMLSLQTIAEGLGDIPDHKVAIMVTSQMDMDAVIGDLTNRQKYDFSRIMARFKPLSLTSANADEVIQRRLLEKTPEAQTILTQKYDKSRNVIKSLLQFGDDSQFKSNYHSADEFAIDFPFVDYQFNLIQQSIVNLSKNNAFSGEKNSVGERSLIAITHEVGKLYKDMDMSHIVQFSDMYEGVRDQLQTKIQNEIIQAERTLDDELALKVLKALFLLKYVSGFPTTVDNITKILLPSFDTDFPDFKSKIQEALNKLVRQSYIDKGAKEDYHFQTNEEKDIENEIKNQELAPDTINKELMKIFRDEIFSENKIKLSTNKIFSYGRFVDEQQDGRDADLYIHFITPNSGLNTTDETAMCTFSMQHQNHLCVVLPEDKYLAEDLSIFKKADKCLSRLLQNSEGHKLTLVSDKRRVNTRRRENILERLTSATKEAKLYMNGQPVEVRASELKARLNEGMSNLVKLVYTDLEMLTVEYDDEMLKRIINDHSTGFWGNTMDACMTEVFNKITRNKQLSIRTKVSDLVVDFKGGTYGWYETATLCILAKLYKLDKISFRNGGNLVEERELYSQLTNSNSRQTLIIDVEETITNSQISKLKNQYRDLFDDESCLAQGAKDVHNAFIARLNTEISKLRDIAISNRYPFIDALNDFITELVNLSRIVYPGLYSKTSEIESLIDLKEDDVEPIVGFVKGAQFDIFKRLNQVMVGNQANMSYVDQTLMNILKEIHKSTTPWKRMAEAKDALDRVHKEIEQRQNDERAKIIAEIDSKFNAIKALPAFATLQSRQANQIELLFTTMKKGAQEERFIGNLIAYASQVENHYINSLDNINRWVDDANRAAQAAAAAAASSTSTTGVKGSTSASSGTSATQTSRNVKKVVNRQKALSVSYPKPMLETKEDVDAYINALRNQLMEYIDRDTNIMLN